MKRAQGRVDHFISTAQQAKALDPLKFRAENFIIPKHETDFLQQLWIDKELLKQSEVDELRADYAKQPEQPTQEKQDFIEAMYVRHIKVKERVTPEWCRQIVRHRRHFDNTVVIFEKDGIKQRYGVLHRHGAPHQCDLLKLSVVRRPKREVTSAMKTDLSHDGWFQTYQHYLHYEPNDVCDEFDIGAFDQKNMWVSSL